VEHHPAREQHRAERQGDREDGESGELEPYRREAPEEEREPEPDSERRERDEDGRSDHGTSR